jgi:Rieske 2Fe-2S family protein
MTWTTIAPAAPAQTLDGPAYHSDETYEVDRERVFFRHWLYAARAERIAEPGQWLRLDIAGESILLVRGKDDRIRGFYNVCRHRGSLLCDESEGKVRTRLRCPYHAWGYALDGSLQTTPMIEADEIDRDALSLWPVRVEVWEGFVFVNMSREEPQPLLEVLADQQDDPLALAEFGLADLRLAHVTTVDVKANWKILMENYNECLHCPTVHPELVAVIPAYRKGDLFEEGREDGGVALADGRTAIATDPRLRLPLLPGLKGHEAPGAYWGAMVYPSMFLDIDGVSAIATAVFPTGPRSCRMVTEYLFSLEAVEDPDFDPTPIVEFNDRVGQQDNEVCERVQRGVTSRAFDHGVFPAKDSWVLAFDERYRRDVEDA